MPVILNVTGPHTIQWNNGTAWADLGRTDNDDLLSIELEHKYMDVFTNEYGMNPADSILMGAVATVNLTMVSYDPAEVLKLLTRAGSAGAGNSFPIVGKRMIGDATTVGIRTSGGATNSNYTISSLKLLGHTIKDVGNKPTRAAFRFEVLRPLTTSTQQQTIYTVTS